MYANFSLLVCAVVVWRCCSAAHCLRLSFSFNVNILSVVIQLFPHTKLRIHYQPSDVDPDGIEMRNRLLVTRNSLMKMKYFKNIQAFLRFLKHFELFLFVRWMSGRGMEKSRRFKKKFWLFHILFLALKLMYGFVHELSFQSWYMGRTSSKETKINCKIKHDDAGVWQSRKLFEFIVEVEVKSS